MVDAQNAAVTFFVIIIMCYCIFSMSMKLPTNGTCCIIALTLVWMQVCPLEGGLFSRGSVFSISLVVVFGSNSSHFVLTLHIAHYSSTP